MLSILDMNCVASFFYLLSPSTMTTNLLSLSPMTTHLTTNSANSCIFCRVRRDRARVVKRNISFSMPYCKRESGIRKNTFLSKSHLENLSKNFARRDILPGKGCKAFIEIMCKQTGDMIYDYLCFSELQRSSCIWIQCSHFIN